MNLTTKHSFLFQPGAWEAVGEFVDADGSTCRSRGESVILHEAGCWVGDSVMRMETSPPRERRSRYTVKPPAPFERTATWIAEDPTAGTLYGTFLFADDLIVSVFSSADGTHSGSEYMRLECDGSYSVHGNLARGKRRISSWRVVLKRR